MGVVAQKYPKNLRRALVRGYLGMHGARTRVHALLMAGCLGNLFFSVLHP